MSSATSFVTSSRMPARPSTSRELHARAGRLVRATAATCPAAVAHLLAAGRGADAADLIAASWNAALQSGRGASVVRWLDALPRRGWSRAILACAWPGPGSRSTPVSPRRRRGGPMRRPPPTPAARCSRAAPRWPRAWRCCGRRSPTAPATSSSAEELGSRAVELEGGAPTRLASGRARDARRSPPFPRRADRRGGATARAGRRSRRGRSQQHGGAQGARNARSGRPSRLAIPTALEAVVAAADEAARRAVARRILDGIARHGGGRPARR